MIRCQYNFSVVYFAALLCLTVEGCSTIQPIDSNLSRQEVMRELHIGSQIEIQTKSGERLSIIVSSISETHIESSDEQFEIEQIEITGLRKPNMVEKTGAVAAVFTIQFFLHVLLPVLIIGLAI